MTSTDMILPQRGARTYFADPLFDHKIDPTMRDGLQTFGPRICAALDRTRLGQLPA
jgi:hypothetical protein